MGGGGRQSSSRTKKARRHRGGNGRGSRRERKYAKAKTPDTQPRHGRPDEARGASCTVGMSFLDEATGDGGADMSWNPRQEILQKASMVVLTILSSLTTGLALHSSAVPEPSIPNQLATSLPTVSSIPGPHLCAVHGSSGPFGCIDRDPTSIFSLSEGDLVGDARLRQEALPSESFAWMEDKRSSTDDGRVPWGANLCLPGGYQASSRIQLFNIDASAIRKAQSPSALALICGASRVWGKPYNVLGPSSVPLVGGIVY